MGIHFLVWSWVRHSFEFSCPLLVKPSLYHCLQCCISFDLNISEVDPFDCTFVCLIHLFVHVIHSRVCSFVLFKQGWIQWRGPDLTPPPPPPHLLDLTLFETEILTLLLHYFEREAEKLMKNLVDNLKQNPSGNWVILIFSGQKSCTRII